MFGRLLIFSAFLLVVVAGIGIFADDQSRSAIEFRAEKVVINGALPSQPYGQDSVIRKNSPSARIVFITAKGCERCEKELSRLRRPGGDFEAMKLRGWKIGETEDSHLQIIDRDQASDLVKRLAVNEYPTVAAIENGEIVRSFKAGPSPLDAWTFGWLLKGRDERPQPLVADAATTRTDVTGRTETTGNYRVRGNHWTLEGDPNPSKNAVVNHLRGPNHGHASGAYGAIDNWSYEELRSLHDDLHEREGGTYGNFAQYQSGPVAANRSLDAFSGNRKVTGK